ncbi:hypothetical protein CH333_10655 [candidate division WOR-3 bacterium JGI_Cruoil_03_44_89]|uniref:DUF5673 domain-containing protein n=1 Tax=candidate division WOR-3 bacterium JGI_Cruoil_03_44_89 TaxID=1973748 RepID=A0A235BN18_UNCW3|nr:MAG: hypothetical protein CH333_10655 [candidate division WOR-3 bacterium JGI_Cruoil_03_44_89]
MKWSSHPCAENKKRTTFLLVFLGVLFVGLFIWFKLWGLLIGIVLVGSALYPYFIPTRYEFSEEYMVIKGFFLQQKKWWGEFRSFYPDRNGVFLSPFPEPTRLENYRGIYIRFGNKRDEVMEYVKKKVKPMEVI